MGVVRLIALAAVALLLAAAEPAQPELEHKVRAAFLLNFTKFVDWPEDAVGNPEIPFTICVIGKDPVGRALDDVVGGEAVNGRRLVVRRFDEVPARGTCQLAYFDASTKGIPQMLEQLGSGVLTVGEGESFVKSGGMIAFLIQARRVRFDINLAAADSAGLRLSSKLLSVAREVKK
ncbi:MAG: YfiR family protein [Acidobacteriaceae bacterium]|nr:YfiR family protein [Acidobacteriaceae bacterium]